MGTLAGMVTAEILGVYAMSRKRLAHDPIYGSCGGVLHADNNERKRLEKATSKRERYVLRKKMSHGPDTEAKLSETSVGRLPVLLR